MDIRKTACLIVLTMIVSIFPSICMAEENSAYALFSSETPQNARMQAALTLGEKAVTSTKSGKTGWVLNPKNYNSSYIRCKIDDDYIYNLKSEDTAEVTVEYYDDSYGGFSIYYDAQGGKRKSEFVQLTRTYAWKAHTFILYDARFANGINTDDFQIITNGTGKSVDENGIMDVSPNTVTISEIRVSKSNFKSPYKITAETDRAGNIFFEGETVSFNVSFKSEAEGFGGENVRYNVLDFNNKSVFVKTSAVSTEKETLVIPDLKYGVYYLEINVASDTVSQNETIDFSYSRKADSMNERFGTNVHYDYNVYNKQDIMDLSDLIKNAGYGFARNSVRWNQVEKVKGSYEMPENTMTAMRYNSRIGLKTLAILSCDNPIYDSPPYLLDSDALRQAYVNYCSYTVGALSPYTNYFASPNEYNLINGVNQPAHAAPFTKLVKAAKPAIMAANPNAFIVSGEIGRYEKEYNQSCYDNGILDACDAFSIHIYDQVGGPEIYTVLPNIQDHYKTLKAANPKKEAWVTETGWPARKMDNINAAKSLGFADEIQQARWYARSFALGSDPNLVDKYFQYAFVDNNVGYYNSERMYGIVHAHDYKTPFAAKPAYVTTAAFNDIVGDAEFKANLSNKDQVYACRFVNSDNEEIMCFWKTERSAGTPEYTYQSDKPYLEISDMYGNTEYIKNDTGSYTVTYGYDPVYIKGIDYIKPEISFPAKSLWFLEDDNAQISIHIPYVAGDENQMQIISAAYDRRGRMLDTDIITTQPDSTEFSIRYQLGDMPDIESIKVMTLENMATLKPLTSISELSYWGNDSGIGCSRNADVITVSGKLPKLSAGETCMITVLSSYMKKENFSVDDLLWQDMVGINDSGEYSFSFKLPDRYTNNKIYIQISSEKYSGRCMFSVK